MHFQIKRSRLLAASIFQHGQGPSVRVRPRQRERESPPSVCAMPPPPVFLLYSPSLSFSPPPLVRRLGPCDVGGLEGMSEGDRDRIGSQFTNGIFLRTTLVIGRNLVAAAARARRRRQRSLSARGRRRACPGRHALRMR